jgi:hypothetical protein
MTSALPAAAPEASLPLLVLSAFRQGPGEHHDLQHAQPRRSH